MRLRYLSQSGHWPSGNPRFYLRKPGQKAKPMPDAPTDSPAFLAAYAAAAGLKAPPPTQHPTGTIGAAITAFLASDRYHAAAASTRAIWRRGLDDMRARYGGGKLDDLQAQHIRIDLARLSAHPSRQRLKIWRALMGWCVDAGLCAADPTAAIRQRPAPKTDGHRAWTRDDLEAFRARWPIGSEQRLCCEIIAWTGARMSDAVRLGDGHVRAGVLRYRQQKTGGEVAIPLTDAPAYAAPDGMLQACLDARVARGMVWMVTAQGAARSQKAASQWFAAACRAAGLRDLTAHGLRKFRAAIMRENGATPQQRAVWLGHESDRQEAEYSRSADKLRIILGTDGEREVPTLEASWKTVR